MYWGQLHPRFDLGGNIINLPPCMGDPARQIRIEEVNRNFENVNRIIVPEFLGYRITFYLNYDFLEDLDMANVIDILNYTGDILLYPWADVAQSYDVISESPEINMLYFQDSANLRFKTKNLIQTLYKP